MNEVLADFDVYGLRVRLQQEAYEHASPDVFYELRAKAYQAAATELEFFKTTVDLTQSPVLLIRLIGAGAERAPKPWLRLRAGIGLIGWHWDRRTVWCDEGSYLEYLPRSNCTEIRFMIAHADEASILTNAIESALGERLEKAGYLRLHAAARLDRKNIEKGSTIVSAPSGGGKSTSTARRLMTSTDLVYSDEITWIKENKVYPFPTPIALHMSSVNEPWMKNWTGSTRTFVGSTKALMRVPHSTIAPPAVIQKLIAIETGSFRSIKWIARIVSGQGLPQMWPYMIRIENFFWLVRLAMKRLNFALRALAQHKVEFQSKTDFREIENHTENLT